MSVFVIRTIILYAIVIFSLRVMGKRQIGELQPSELVVAIMISDLASVPMQSIDIPLFNGIIPVLTLIVAEITMSFNTLKSRRARRFLTGEPNVVIYKGHINEHELERLRFNLNDLMEELRMNGYPNIADIHTAVLETNGQISIIPKPYARPATVKDLNIKNAEEDILPYMIVSDGMMNIEEIQRSGHTPEWVEKELKKYGAANASEVFIASLDNSGKLFVQMKGSKDIEGQE